MIPIFSTPIHTSTDITTTINYWYIYLNQDILSPHPRSNGFSPMQPLCMVSPLRIPIFPRNLNTTLLSKPIMHERACPSYRRAGALYVFLLTALKNRLSWVYWLNLQRQSMSMSRPTVTHPWVRSRVSSGWLIIKRSEPCVESSISGCCQSWLSCVGSRRLSLPGVRTILIRDRPLQCTRQRQSGKRRNSRFEQ